VIPHRVSSRHQQTARLQCESSGHSRRLLRRDGSTRGTSHPATRERKHRRGVDGWTGAPSPASAVSRRKRRHAPIDDPLAHDPELIADSALQCAVCHAR